MKYQSRSSRRQLVETLENRALFSSLSVHVFPQIGHSSSFLQNLVSGPDGNVYFSSGLANQIASISPTGGVSDYDTTSVSPHGLSGVAVGPDGNIWFDELFANAVGSLNLTTKKVAPLKITSGKVNSPVALTTGPDGNLWADGFDAQIERISTSGEVATFSFSGSGSGPITSFNHELYFANGDAVDRISTSGVLGSPITAVTGGTIQDLSVGTDGDLWFTEKLSSGVDDYFGYVTPNNSIKEFAVAKTVSDGTGDVTGIASPADGNIYFRDGDYLIGSTTGGSVFLTQNLGSGSSTSSTDLIVGPDGNLWFNEGFNDKIGYVVVAGGISGKVSNAGTGAGLAGIRVFLDTAHTGVYTGSDPSVLTSATGTYRFNVAPGKYSVGIVTPSGDKLTNAGEIAVSVTDGSVASANFALVVNSGTPLIGVNTVDGGAAEGIFGSPASSGVITLTRESGGSGAVSIDLSVGGTAAINTDYKITVYGGSFTYDAGTKELAVTLAAGASGAAIVITPLSETVHKSAETVTLSLLASPLYQEDGSKLSGLVTIAAH
jgi:streptogramin lyase